MNGVEGTDMSESAKILVVEDSRFFASLLTQQIQDGLGLAVDWVSTYSEACSIIDTRKDEYLLALLDANLPDAPNGEAIEYACKMGLPAIVFTSGIDDTMRNRFLSWNLLDYILKDSGNSMEVMLDSISRAISNRHIKVAVVEDSSTTREAVRRMLQSQLFQVFEAENGQKALELLEANPDIKLVVTDYDMPVMDGFELIRTVRQNHSRDELGIIGMSASGDPLLSAQLLKSGADDYVSKPFLVEEFICRVNKSIEMLQHIETIRELSYRDPLTGLRNRRYFFENAPGFIESCQSEGVACSLAMMDVDFFKSVNDSFGHDGGDAVLKLLSHLFKEHFGENSIISRFGGEEFCVLVRHESGANASELFEPLRERIERTPALYKGAELRVTISIGVSSRQDGLDAMIRRADTRLYSAKSEGRNRVITE
ncbi:MAG: diguanylate cyclase response regulator [Desulfovibrio sp.]|nr:diguanylate cyclase response regulator [Desulfovibrio sp.]|tara:strand:- start:1372 stop:2649 length:1278 start_codon:yes stop_codon:yes gene_type:complete